jgi:hypothetical protein
MKTINKIIADIVKYINSIIILYKEVNKWSVKTA